MILRNQLHFLTTFSWEHSTWMQAERNHSWGIQENVRIFNVCWSNWKNHRGGKTHHAKTVAWCYDMERHAQKMFERFCEVANKKNRAGRKSFKSLLGWSSTQERGTRISWRIVKSLVTTCLEMLVLDTIWTNWHSVVGQQACKISHNMDRILWQTFSSFDFIHSSHTHDYRQGLFRGSDFAGNFEDS